MSVCNRLLPAGLIMSDCSPGHSAAHDARATAACVTAASELVNEQ